MKSMGWREIREAKERMIRKESIATDALLMPRWQKLLLVLICLVLIGIGGWAALTLGYSFAEARINRDSVEIDLDCFELSHWSMTAPFILERYYTRRYVNEHCGQFWGSEDRD